uniref:Uncharacterized protein n=1 Tax=viral metagenome TaxID=1070528 RepID=A0A6C0H0N3_9ZZZZ
MSVLWSIFFGCLTIINLIFVVYSYIMNDLLTGNCLMWVLIILLIITIRICVNTYYQNKIQKLIRINNNLREEHIIMQLADRQIEIGQRNGRV